MSAKDETSRFILCDFNSPRLTYVECFVSGVGGGIRVESVAFPELEGKGVGSIVAGIANMMFPGSTGGSVGLICSGLTLLTKNVRVPLVASDRQADTIESEVARSIPFPISDVVWDYALLSEDALEQHIALVATRREPIEEICEALVRRGLTPSSVGVVPTLALVGKEECLPGSEEASLVVFLEQELTHLIFSHNGEFFVRSLKSGAGGQLDIQYEKRLETDLTRAIAAHRRQNSSGAPVQIYFSGGFNDLEGLALRMGEKLGIQSSVLDAKSRIDFSPAVLPEDVDRLGPDLLPLVGAVSASGSDPRRCINLLPPVFTQRAHSKSRGRWLLISSVLLVIAGVVFVANPFLQRSRLEATLSDIRTVKTPIAAQAAVLSGIVNRIDSVETRIQSIKELAGSRSNWVNFLVDLQERLVSVEDVWIDSLKVVRLEEPSVPSPSDASVEGEVFEDWQILEEREPEPANNKRMELFLRGRMIDRNHPLQRVSDEMRKSVSDLIDKFAESEFISGVSDKKFDTSEKGILRFEFSLNVNPERPL